MIIGWVAGYTVVDDSPSIPLILAIIKRPILLLGEKFEKNQKNIAEQI